jgi:hypothetical protein
MATKYLDSGALDPNINPIYASETTPTSGVSAGTTTTQPSVGSIALDTPQNTCDQKWAIYSANMTFPTQEAYMTAYNAYLATCLNTGVNPVTTTTPTVGASIVSPILNEEIKPIRTTTTTPTTSTAPATSTIVNPLPILIGGFPSGGFGGGFGGGGNATIQEDGLVKSKKPFPYWLIAVAVVGGYLIFRKN